MDRKLAIVTAIVVLAGCAAVCSSSYAAPSTEVGEGACYSRRLIGHRTTSGQRYDPKALTAAHATIPNGTRVKVINVENQRSVVVRVNDRMSSHAGGIIMDLSQRACHELKFGPGGKGKIKLEVLTSRADAE
jgi:rare lipoprotein A